MKLAIFIWTFVISFTSFSNESNIYIKIGDAQSKKSVVAFPEPKYSGTLSLQPGSGTTGIEIYRVIQNDLLATSFFQFLDPSAFLEDTKKTDLVPITESPNGFKFDSWKSLGTDFIIRSEFSIINKTLTFHVYTYSVEKNKKIFEKKYSGPLTALRKIAHTFCNDFMSELTGKTGPFLSQLVVSSDKGGGKFREIYVMDWDGFNAKKITNHKSVAMSPAWSPDGKKIAYTAFAQRAKSKIRNADLFVYELSTEKRWLTSYRSGTNSGAFFSPDNKFIYLTISQQNGDPDIYKMSIEGELIKKITHGPRGVMNVEPAISPDGTQLAFSSDRSGQPMIYTTDVEGNNPAKRLTFKGKYNSSPAWSSDGKRLAFAGWDDDHFDIFTMKADGSDIIRITSAKKPDGKKWANNEDPSYSPDGRLLVYASNRSGTYQIYISNLDGTEERRITNDNNNYFKPKWSINQE